MGGIPEKNYLLLSMTALLLDPNIYVESGFYKGSSLHAVCKAKSLRRIIGFDPDHSNFKVVLPDHLDVSLIKSDFAEYNFQQEDLSSSLIYFDDHINSAQRILQASDKGFKNLIFDDSCGLTGTVERVYPSMPSLFFIEHIDKISEGDEIFWSIKKNLTYKFLDLFNVVINKGKIYLRFKFDKTTIQLCHEAKRRISSINRMPDLNDFINSEHQRKNNDLSQYLVILK